MAHKLAYGTGRLGERESKLPLLSVVGHVCQVDCLGNSYSFLFLGTGCFDQAGV